MHFGGMLPDEIDFEREVEDALATLPRDLGEAISNVEIVVEERPVHEVELVVVAPGNTDGAPTVPHSVIGA